jgi:hypothetical protein
MEITKDECIEPLTEAYDKFDELVDCGVFNAEDDEFFDIVAGFFFTAGVVYVANKYGIKTPAMDVPDVRH